MILDIKKYGADKYGALRKKCINVKPEHPSIQKLIDDMFETVKFYGGVGLAAPQVDWSLNMFIINTPSFQEVLINPEVSAYGNHLQVREGCLSFPNLETPTSRQSKVAVRYLDRNWIQRTRDLEGLLAIIVQHEYDHLQGKLIIDF